ncbi:MAG: type II secretion system protein, partial [bacterium]|nr:type II secretion system protein [bacterium]
MQKSNLKFKLFLIMRRSFSLLAFRFKFKRGFTLVEMIVAVAVFTVVMVSGIGALMSMIDANRKAQSLRIVMDNLNFALENITRTMRVGIDYHCGRLGDLHTPRDCALEGDSFIAFKDSGGDLLIFNLNNGRIEKSSDGGATYLGITAPEITIQELKFFVRGSTSADQIQPEVLVIVRGIAGVTAKVRTTFNLQTTVSQRLLDVSSVLPPPPPPASSFPVVAGTNTSSMDPANVTLHT